MSLILEALRKSEAERRRGQVPNLHAERAPAAQPARAARPSWPWLVLATLALLATAWLARGVWSPPSRAVDPSSDTVGQPVPTEAAIVESYARDAGTGSRAGAASATPLDPATLARTPPTPRVASAATTTAPGSTAIAPPPAEDAPTPARDANVAATRVVPSLPPAGTAPLPRASTAPTPAMAPAVAPPTPATAIAAAPLRLSDLSAAERLELPPLKLSMHLWDPAPAQRFAIIDGARVNEGDRLGEAVVDEITANAVVLAWRGQRLQIPLR